MQRSKQWLKTLGAAVLVLVIVIIALPQMARIAWQDSIYPGVTLGNIELGNKTQEQARDILLTEWNRINEEGIEFRLSGERVVIYPTVTSPGDPDLSYELISLDLDATLAQAFAIGRQKNTAQRVLQPYKSLLQKTPIRASITINKTALSEALKDNFKHIEQPAQNAQFNITGNIISVIPEQRGQEIDTDSITEQLQQHLPVLENTAVSLNTIEDLPEVTAADITPLIPEAQELFTHLPFVLSVDFTEANGRRFSWSDTATTTMVETWLAATKRNDKAVLTFNEAARAYLERISPDINREPLDAKFDIADNGRITQFQSSQDGLELDIKDSIEAMNRELIQNKQNKAKLVIHVVEPSITTEEANNLGIKEILGVGKSDFSGSPRNRRVNIQVASDKLNGLLVPPGEEFSLLSALRPFTTEAGYLPELVIKGSKLVPEVGGGACQIGTTTFRGALAAGLEITQRSNHSFAVSYYNDENGLPGTDATIYDPAPDFKFKNNTENYILLQTHVGDDDILSYEFWGTSDHRTASTTKPQILSSYAAPETKYIETEDLEPGTTECSGHNVPGYNTTFKYAVLREDGTFHEENFDSYYRPFQQVCLVGVEKKETENEQVNNQ